MGTGFLIAPDIVMTVKHNIITADELLEDEDLDEQVADLHHKGGRVDRDQCLVKISHCVSILPSLLFFRMRGISPGSS